MRKILIGILVVLAGICVQANAANDNKLNIKLSSNTANTGETFIINLELKLSSTGANINSPEITIPNLDQSLIIRGDSQSTSMQIINNTSQIITGRELTIEPTKVGKFKIGPAIAKMGNEDIKSDTVEITVNKGNGNNTNSIPQNIPNQPTIPDNIDTPSNFDSQTFIAPEQESIFTKIKSISIIDIVLTILFIGIIIVLLKLFLPERKKINKELESSKETINENLESILKQKMSELGVIDKSSNLSFEDIHKAYGEKYGDNNSEILSEVIEYLNKAKYGAKTEVEKENELIEKIKKII